MKWYSVKKYRPSIRCAEYIVLTRDGIIYIAENVHMRDGRIEWEREHDDNLLDVTHFCIPDPVEIEND